MISRFPFPGSDAALPSAAAHRPANAAPTLESTPHPQGGGMDLAWDDTQPMERPSAPLSREGEG